MSNKDSMGDRMKNNYESVTKFFLPRRTYTILRIDGKAFHTYTRNCERPYDRHIADAMMETAVELCIQISGAKYAYTQSDEISVLMTDFDTIRTEPYFGGNVQKLASVTASIATARFNSVRNWQYSNGFITESDHAALFDARVFTISDRNEVINYFIWRQRDAIRNSISGLARKYFSHRELHKCNTDKMQDMLFLEHGINWNDIPDEQKRGHLIHYMDEGWSVRPPMKWEWTDDLELQRLTPWIS